jgi:hypothetical protein
MGLFNRKDERAIPEPGTPEFEAVVAGTAIPDGQSTEMGASGWADPEQLPSESIDLQGTDAREKVEDVLREHGIDPDKEGQQVDASTVPGLQKAIFAALGVAGLRIPNAEGFGGGISAPRVDPAAQIEHLAHKRDAGEITEAEFEAQKKRLLG